MTRADVFVSGVAVVLLGMVACQSSTRDFGGGHAGNEAGGNGEAGKSGAAPGGAGTAGTAAAGGRGGSAGVDAQGGDAGSADDAGAAGLGNEPAGSLTISIPSLASGKTYVPYTGAISASGGVNYSWSIASGSLPAGLTLQSTQSATVMIAGTASEAGQFPISLSVSDGSSTAKLDLTLTITHSVLFISDRNTSGLNELFLSEIGGSTAPMPVRVSASFPTGGGVSSFAWSPDGSKVLYVATQSATGTPELWVASLATPGSAQRVSASGVSVGQIGWLRSGDIAAYATSTADAYLVDLSGSTPGASKLAVTGSSVSTTAGLGVASFLPSPNGKSIAFPYYVPMLGAIYALPYVSWELGSPKSSVPLVGGAGDFLGYSYDGRFVVTTSSGIGSLVDLSATPPAAINLGGNFSSQWSPTSPVLLYYGDLLSTDPVTLKRGTFAGGTLTSTPLVPASSCPSNMVVAPWSPDGKMGLFRCLRDLRGISNVATATVGTDFSLLPSGFLSNGFTDISDVAWSPDSAWIGMRTDRDVNAQNDLYLIRWAAPGAAYKVHANSIAPGVTTWSFAPNSQSIAFVGTISPQANAGLYLSKLPASGAPPFATLVSTPASAVVQNDLNWLPGARVLTYRAAVSGANQLFAVPVASDGSTGSVVSISGAAGTVSSYQLVPPR